MMSERERFEKWMTGVARHPDQALDISGGVYSAGGTHIAWKAWQARADLAAEEMERLEAKLRVAERRVRRAAVRIGALEYVLDQAKLDAQENSDG